VLTLAIDTSTNILSLALGREGKLLASVNELTQNNHSAILMSKINHLITTANLTPANLEQIVVAQGPGSYTGIRVGVVTAKSLAYALRVPVIGISSLKCLAHTIAVDNGVLAPVIDARRGTVFASALAHDGRTLISEGHYDLKDFLSQLANQQVTFIGDGAVVNAETIITTMPSATITKATAITRSKAEVLASLALKASKVANIHGLLPNYLRKTEAEQKLNG